MGEWARVRLGDLVEVKHGFAFKGEYFSDVPDWPVLVTPANIEIGGGFKRAAREKFYSGPVPEGFFLAEGDLVVTMTDLSKAADALGYPAIIPGGRTYLHNQRIGLVRITAEGVLKKQFLYYLLRTSKYHEFILSSASGSTVRHTSPDRICRYETRVPSLGEQRAIVEVLGALDDKIGLNERMAETVLALGRSVFRQETQLAGMEATVGDLATFNYGKALPAPLRQPGSVPVFGCTGQVGFHDTALTRSAHPVVGRKGANAGHVSWLPEPGWIIDTAFYAVPKRKEVSNEVLYFALDAAGISALIADSAVPGVNRDVALRHKFRVPEFGRLERLSAQAEALLATCQQAAAENRTLADLRDTLLPQLLTGKLRVKDATRVVEEAV